MLARREVGHDLHQVTDHFFADPPHQGGSFFGNANHHFAPIFARARTHHVTEIFQPIDQTAGGRRRVSHLLRDGGHREHFLVVQGGEEKKLREGNIARRQFFAEMQNETTLHFQDDVGEPLGVSAKLIKSVEFELSGGIQTA